MPDTLVFDLAEFLDRNGDLLLEPSAIRTIGAYLAAIVLMASHPDYPEEYRVNCAMKPNNRSCLAELAGFANRKADEIVWKCPKCGTRGKIIHWQGTIWDMSSPSRFSH